MYARARLSLARALLAPGRLWLLDEPTRSLDVDARASARATLSAAFGTAASMIVTHDLEDVPDGKVPGRDVIIYGHTHEPSVRLRDKQLFVNPGELCGLLTGKSTVAVVDTEAMTAEIVEL